MLGNSCPCKPEKRYVHILYPSLKWQSSTIQMNLWQCHYWRKKWAAGRNHHDTDWRSTVLNGLPVIIMCWEKGKLMQLQQQLILSRSLQVSLRAWDCFILPQAILEVARQQISWIYQAFLGCRLEQSFQANVSWTLCWPGWFVPPDDLCFESNPHMGWAGGVAWGSTSGCLHWESIEDVPLPRKLDYQHQMVSAINIILKLIFHGFSIFYTYSIWKFQRVSTQTSVIVHFVISYCLINHIGFSLHCRSGTWRVIPVRSAWWLGVPYVGLCHTYTVIYTIFNGVSSRTITITNVIAILYPSYV